MYEQGQLTYVCTLCVHVRVCVCECVCVCVVMHKCIFMRERVI